MNSFVENGVIYYDTILIEFYTTLNRKWASKVLHKKKKNLYFYYLNFELELISYFSIYKMLLVD